MSNATAQQKLVAYFLGPAFLLATVVGSGIMAERLADGPAEWPTGQPMKSGKT